ncbi:Core-2/I-branching beta-1,6-N-acetylglucosaminyltransferase family protein [Salix suchowensis]|nr:Core-2/I-branching beta-1,6-N-acetylglucosaminyltransferase family protein [Salix suchowensis]
MMKKMKSSKPQHLLWFGFKIVIALCFSSYFVFAYLNLHSQVKLPSLSRHFEGTPKIAFLFLARRDLPLDFLWDSFFKNVDAAKFSIYIHSTPGFLFNETTTRSAFFHGQQLNYSIQVIWGESSMIEAEKLLLLAALHDPANQRFVLLSDSCVPLYSFTYLYSYLMSSSKSFVDSFIDVEEDRYSPKMSPIIRKDRWRKGSQWISLVRRHAKIVAEDYFVFPIFKEFCKRWPPKDVDNRKETHQIFVTQYFLQTLLRIFKRHRNCIPDEHYVQTLLAMNGLEDDLERRTLTYTKWNHSIIKAQTSWHPLTFHYDDVTAIKIREIKAINSISRKQGNRSENCHVNNIQKPCFLFARKFTQRAASHLLTQDLVDFS